MTEQEQRIAILQRLGWSHLRYVYGNVLWGFKETPTSKWTGAGCIGDTTLIPDPLHDLNACFQMEEALTDEEYREFEGTLLGICDGNTFKGRCVTHATADQRCEAFLRTKGILKNTLTS